MVKTMFEIAETTELGKQVWQIVENGNPQNKVVVVDVSEWEAFEAWKSAQQSVVPDFASVGDFCANCKQPWPCACSDAVHSCGVCAGVIGQDCRCSEREFIPQTRKAGKL